MKTSLVQLDMCWEDKAATKRRIESLLSSCGSDTDLMIFPEMTLTGFSMNADKTSCDDADMEFFASIARRFSCAVIYGAVENGFNCQRTLDKDGESIACYRKIHLFSYAGEDNFYSAGSEALTFKLNGANITPFVCYDLRFPYLFWEKAAETDIFIVNASWPASRSLHWKSLLRARAIENQAFVIGVNRAGNDPKFNYSGDSAVYSPLGEAVLECGSAEGIFTAEIDIETVAEARRFFPFQRDRLR
ncbi:hypothetical protein EP073_12435 [Geovibrio thiophilus]|uniref:CN hydrolase domain-containing protein n=1 Tax=Geovibrio thiophilus TaxID=139438 RepID=A0A3R5XY96_9BACT|nr:nitrilase-related carbon-nitrogen hydrolase [Geovibrio thiophilus]QAR34182.1 hypothetical protein EP073_12435 [Geovibrio thiophilus]